MHQLTISLLAVCLFCRSQASQPTAAQPISAPLRELPWGQLNFLHTTDTHGWHAGHLQEPSYSADWGDYISFSKHLRRKADNEGNDLLLIDTGDRIEGNGLYDASRPKGKYDLNIFAQQDIDVICSGNHELYKQSSVDFEYNTTAVHFQRNYIASDLDYVDIKTGDRKPFAQRFKKFTTKNQNIRILAFGFLFDFRGAASNAHVQDVEATIHEEWFQQAIRDRDVDLFLVVGHMALRSPEVQAIYRAIRDQQWDVPIQFFAGHAHVRDFLKLDNRAYGLASGRYLETIGSLAISGLVPKSQRPFSAASMKFSRRYIDNNLFSFHHHSATNESTFATPDGEATSRQILVAREKLDLDFTFGCAPHDFWTNRAPFPDKDSVFSLLQDTILPSMVYDSRRGNVSRAIIVNTGAIRFDIFKGPFTRDSLNSISPFTTGFRYIKDVPRDIQRRILEVLNKAAPSLEDDDHIPLQAGQIEHSVLGVIKASSDSFNDYKGHSHTNDLAQADADDRASLPLTPGYTTHDDAGDDGDDTYHLPIKVYPIPNCIEADVGISDHLDTQSTSPSELKARGFFANDTPQIKIVPDVVDVIYNAFVEKYILLALRFLGSEITEADTLPYMGDKSMSEVIGAWISENWKCEEVS